MAASPPATKGQPAHGGKVVSWLSKVFEFNPAGLNWPRAVMILDIMLVPLVVFWAIGHEQYLVSALFGVIFAGLVAGLLAKRAPAAKQPVPAGQAG